MEHKKQQKGELKTEKERNKKFGEHPSGCNPKSWVSPILKWDSPSQLKH